MGTFGENRAFLKSFLHFCWNPSTWEDVEIWSKFNQNGPKREAKWEEEQDKVVQCGQHEALKQLIPSCSVYNKHWSNVMLMVDSVLYSGTGWLVSVPKPTGLNIQALASLKLVPQLLSKRKASGSHASWLKPGKTGLRQKLPVLHCVLQAFCPSMVLTPSFPSPVTCSCTLLCCSANCAGQVVHVFAW